MNIFKNPKKAGKYILDEALGRLLGFIVAMSATSVVSNFFETRGFKNLWGLTAKKKLVSKETFANYEWIASVIIGFIVLELYNKYVKEKMDYYISLYFHKTNAYLKSPAVQDNWIAKKKSMQIIFQYIISFFTRTSFYSQGIHPLIDKLQLQYKNIKKSAE